MPKSGDPAPIETAQPTETTAPTPTLTETTGTTAPTPTLTETTARPPTPTVRTPRTGPLTTPPSVRGTDAYLPAGVIDQIFPPGTEAFKMLAGGQCGPLLSEVKETWTGMPAALTLLYKAGAEACLSNWSEARADFGRIDLAKICNKDDPNNNGWDSSFATQKDCVMVRMMVYKWTAALLNAQKTNPTFVPNFPSPPTP